MQEQQIHISPIKREIGVDALRLFAMFLVVMLHLAGCGFMTHIWNKIIWAFTFVCVNCFGLISGYVNMGRTHRYRTIFRLWIQVLWYSLGITLICRFFLPCWVSKVDLIKSCTPFLSCSYWYFTAYAFLLLVMSALDIIVERMEYLALRNMIVCMGGVFSLIIAFRSSKWDVLGLVNGFGFVWLAYLYIIGATAKKYPFWRHIRARWWLVLYVVFSLGSFGVSILAEKVKIDRLDRCLQSYTMITVFLASLCISACFYKIRAVQNYIGRAITCLAPLSFGIYLLHVHPVIWRNVFEAQVLGNNHSVSSALILALVIAIIGLFVEKLRLWFMNGLQFCMRKVIHAASI